MASLEYTATCTVPSGARTKPADCRERGLSLPYPPVAAATLPASALCPTGKHSLCLATSAAEVSSSSTDSATTLTPSSLSASNARENAASCALQYGHQEPR